MRAYFWKWIDVGSAKLRFHDSGSDEEVDMKHSFAQQWFTAPYLLKLETQVVTIGNK